MDKTTTTITIKHRKGIDDLKGLFAYIGNSQGDTSHSNELNADKASEGWMSFVFDCPQTQEAIDQEVERRKSHNEAYIAELKASGQYGQEYDTKISFVKHPIFDNQEPKESMPSRISYSFMHLNNKGLDKYTSGIDPIEDKDSSIAIRTLTIKQAEDKYNLSKDQVKILKDAQKKKFSIKKIWRKIIRIFS